VPCRAWRLLFNQALDHLWRNAAGLVQFWPQCRRYDLIEVKGRYRGFVCSPLRSNF
jgi:hypothetical protein